MVYGEHVGTYDDELSAAERDFDEREKGNFVEGLEEVKKESELAALGIENDHGMYFYTVKKGDTIWDIRETLRTLKQFDYLNYPPYIPHKTRKKVSAWNMPDKSLIPGRQIPIPQALHMRKLDNIDTVQLIEESLGLLAQNPLYSHIVEALSGCSTDHLAAIISTFLEKESNHGTNALYRWEGGKINDFSYSWFHFIFKSGYHFGEAANRLGYSKGEVVSDITKATAVFFAGLFEKTKKYIERAKHGTRMKTYSFGGATFDMNTVYADGYAGLFDEKNIKHLAWLYNGISKQGETYANDFIKKYTQQKQTKKVPPKISKLSPIGEEKPTQMTVEKKKVGVFTELQKNSTGMRVRKYVIHSGGTAGRVQQLFRQKVDDRTPVVVTNARGDKYALDHNFKAGESVYLVENSVVAATDTEYREAVKTWRYHVTHEDVSTSGTAFDIYVLKNQIVSDLFPGKTAEEVQWSSYIDDIRIYDTLGRELGMDTLPQVGDVLTIKVVAMPK